MEESWAAPLDDLRRTALELGARAAEQAGTPDGVEAGRHAAALARVLSIRDPDAEWVGRARAWLEEASRRRRLPGACDAALELARLEARAAGDLAAAYRVAFRTSRRFPEETDCVAEAERILAVLSPWRPSASELAAIEADFDADDPTAGLELGAGEAANPDLTGWAAARADRDATATLEGITVLGHGDEADAEAVRVVLRFDRVVAFQLGQSDREEERPRRRWFELQATVLGDGVARAADVGRAGLLRVLADPNDRGARVTFDLEDDARLRAFLLSDPFRVVVDVDRGGPTASVGRDRRLRAPGSAAPGPRDPSPVELVVLDPGHGGNDFGARAFGLREADLTLDLALRVRVLLARHLPEVRVVLTRETDEVVSLEHRVAMANALGADLFLSIHLNAADEEVQRGGVTTFVLDTSDDQQALRLAARENGTTEGEVDSLARILASLHREDQVRASRAFAEQVHRTTLESARRILPDLYDRGVRSALFHVLVGARMPAVLLEASFLSREPEARALRTTEYRQALADGIARGVARWARR